MLIVESQPNNTQHVDTQHNNCQYKDTVMALCVALLFMLSVKVKPIVLSIVIPRSVTRLNKILLFWVTY